MSLWRDLVSSPSVVAEERDLTIDQYGSLLGMGMFGAGVTQTLADGRQVESVASSFTGYAGAHSSNGPIFALIATRQYVFSAVRFQFQRILAGRPSELFGSSVLKLLERPWPGGTTQDLLSRMELDASLAGNSYWTLDGAELVHLRPDWVRVILEPRLLAGGQAGWRKIGYEYVQGGLQSGSDPVYFLPRDVAHYAPLPDPLASYRGMSWLTPVVREVEADNLMTRHKRRFFENGATPNMVIKYPETVNADAARRMKAALDQGHAGTWNAYKTLYVGAGADVTVVGSSLDQIDFKRVQGAGETRLAAAAGVPSIIVGFSEGQENATYSNYGQARRRFADGTLHPLWQNAAGSLETLFARDVTRLGNGGQVRLWYDSRDVPFLREDEKAAAEIMEIEARTMRTLVDGGYTPESVQRAVMSGDYGLLVHSGLMSVQLQPPGQNVVGQTPSLNTGGTDA